MPQFFGGGKPPLGIVFDSDLGDGIDDVLALAMLYGFEGKNQARLISTSTSKSNVRAAAFCDALARFYSGPPPQPGSPGFAFMRPPAAIGMAENGKLGQDTPVIDAVLNKKTEEGKPAYATGISKLNDTADAAALIRNAFTAQNDENAAVVLAGPATNLVSLFALPGVLDLIKRKVKVLAIDEPRLQADPEAAKRLLAAWPTPIVAASAELGAQLPFPGEAIAKDFGWTPNHPVVDAYLAYHPMPYDAPAPAMAAALYAVHPDDYFKLSDPSPDSKVRHLILDPSQKEKVLQTYVEMASAKPVVRAPRFRGAQKKDAAAPPKKL